VKHILFSSLFSLTILLSLGQTAWAEEEKDGPYFVQVLSFMANVEEKGERAGQVPTTPYLKTATKKNAARICKKFSHVREAVIGTAFNETITIDGRGKPVYDKMQAKMKRAVNRALRKKLVSSLILMKGAHPMGQGTASKLPYNSMGCRALKVLPTLAGIRKKRMGQ